MKIATAAAVVDEIGPLTKIVNDFCSKQFEVMAAGVRSPLDWEPVAEFLDVNEFKRVGAYLEELNWPDYRKFLTGWVGGGTRFEMTVFYIRGGISMAAPVVRFRIDFAEHSSVGPGKIVFSKPFEMPVLCHKGRATLG
jgi:hypothetical protein